MPNYDYANSAGLTALSERTFEKIKSKITTDVVTSEAANPLVLETDAAQYAKKTHLTLEPVQDLHGYDHPWPAGGGKNLLATSVRTETVGGVTFVVNTDGTILVNGTSTDDVYFRVATNMNLTISESIKYSVVSSNNSLFYRFGFDKKDSSIADTTTASLGTDLTINNPSNVSIVWVQLKNGTTYNNVKVYPMIRLASVSDSAWEPYSNICPISGLDEVEVKRTGKNLWSYGDVVVNGSLKEVVLQEPLTLNTCCISLLVTSSDTDATTCILLFYYSDGTTSNAVTFNRNTRDTVYVDFTGKTITKICFYSSDNYVHGNGDTATFKDIQIELGSTATDYEPYTSSTSSLDLPEPVYSGTLDLETGELVCDRRIVDLGTLNWVDNTSGLSGRYLAPLSSDAIVPSGTGDVFAVCEAYPRWEVDASTSSVSQPDVTFYVCWTQFSGIKRVVIRDTNVASVTALKANLDGVGLVYSLETPITYHLTPQQLALFKGINNISTNAKTVQVTYRNGELATTGDIVESTEVAKRSILGEAASDTDAKLATSLAPILGNFATAETSPTSASHAIGEYLLYNNRLYKVLAAISAGQQLTIGTNVGQTNVAAELASQANAISALNSKTAGTFTVDSALSGYENNLIVAQYGKIIVINGYINNVTLPNSRFKLGSISGVSMPNTDVRALCTIADHAYENGSQSYVNITSGGNMYIVPVGSGTKAIYMNISYIAA